MSDNKRIFRGRKLILDWGNIKIELSKLPYFNGQKDPMFELFGSDVVLANVYEGEDGKLTDEILGTPAGIHGDGKCVEGYRIENYLTDDCFWMTIGEASSQNKNDMENDD